MKSRPLRSAASGAEPFPSRALPVPSRALPFPSRGPVPPVPASRPPPSCPSVCPLPFVCPRPRGRVSRAGLGLPPARGGTGPAAAPPLSAPGCLPGLPAGTSGPGRVPASVPVPEEPRPFVCLSVRPLAGPVRRLPCAGTAGWTPPAGEVAEIFVSVHMRRLMGSLCPSGSTRLTGSFCPSV